MSTVDEQTLYNPFLIENNNKKNFPCFMTAFGDMIRNEFQSPVPTLKNKKKQFQQSYLMVNNKKSQISQQLAPNKAHKSPNQNENENENQSPFMLSKHLLFNSPTISKKLGRRQLTSPCPNDPNAILLNRTPARFPIVVPKTPNIDASKLAHDEMKCHNFFERHVPRITPKHIKKQQPVLYNPDTDLYSTILLKKEINNKTYLRETVIDGDGALPVAAAHTTDVDGDGDGNGDGDGDDPFGLEFSVIFPKCTSEFNDNDDGNNMSMNLDNMNLDNIHESFALFSINEESKSVNISCNKDKERERERDKERDNQKEREQREQKENSYVRTGNTLSSISTSSAISALSSGLLHNLHSTTHSHSSGLSSGLLFDNDDMPALTDESFFSVHTNNTNNTNNSNNSNSNNSNNHSNHVLFNNNQSTHSNNSISNTSNSHHSYHSQHSSSITSNKSSKSIQTDPVLIFNHDDIPKIKYNNEFVKMSKSVILPFKINYNSTTNNPKIIYSADAASKYDEKPLKINNERISFKLFDDDDDDDVDAAAAAATADDHDILKCFSDPSSPIFQNKNNNKIEASLSEPTSPLNLNKFLNISEKQEEFQKKKGTKLYKNYQRSKIAKNPNISISHMYNDKIL